MIFSALLSRTLQTWVGKSSSVPEFSAVVAQRRGFWVGMVLYISVASRNTHSDQLIAGLIRTRGFSPQVRITGVVIVAGFYHDVMRA